MVKPSILIIEDEEALQDFYRDLLADYQTETVGDGFAALAKNYQYDLYVVDIGLPHMDGFTTIGKLREKYPDLKAIVVTGYDPVQYTDQVKKHRVEAIFQKPFPLREFLDKVGELIEI